MDSLLGLMLCLGCDLAAATAPPAGGVPVDVELVLAVDTSRSMDPEESELQRAGYVDALRHPDFVSAVRSGLHRRIAITYFEWAGTVRTETVVGWHVVDGAESAGAFASKLEARASATYRGTSISGALRFASRLFDNEFEGSRLVIDISGDGPNNVGLPVIPERDTAVSAGIVVNGLPILIRPSAQAFGELDRYYAECVTGGPGSFVLPVRQSSEFATAIRRKLIMEVSATPDAAPVVPVQAAPVDCERGEGLRRLFSDPYFPELDLPGPGR